MSSRDKMGKLTTYLMAMCVWVLLFNFAGLIDGGSTYLLTNVGILNPENLASSAFYTTLTAIFGIALVGIAIGTALFREFGVVLLAKNSAIASLLLVLTWDLLALFRVMITTNRHVALLIFVPLMLVYILTLVEWLGGKST